MYSDLSNNTLRISPPFTERPPPIKRCCNEDWTTHRQRLSPPPQSFAEVPPLTKNTFVLHKAWVAL